MSVQDPHRGERLPRAVGHWPTGEAKAQTPDGRVGLELSEYGDLWLSVTSGGAIAALDEANVRALQGLLAAAWSRMTEGKGP